MKTFDQLIQQERTRFSRESKKYDRLVELGGRLRVPILHAIFRLTIRDESGQIKTSRESYCHSWIRNLYNAYTDQTLSGGRSAFGNTYADGSLARKILVGAIINTLYTSVNDVEALGGYFSAAADDGRGMLVGTGTSAVIMDDFELDTLIEHGNAAGELDYSACTLGSKAWNVVPKYWKSIWTRDFVNNSGGTITVNELGICNVQSLLVYLFLRDLVSPGQDVLNTETLTVDLEFRNSYP